MSFVRNANQLQLKKLSYPNETNVSTLKLADTTAEQLDILPNRNSTSKQHLLGILDQTLTVTGGRCMRDRVLHPYINNQTIENSHDLVEYLMEQNSLRDTICGLLSNISDIERYSRRIFMKVVCKEIGSTISSLYHFAKMYNIVHKINTFKKVLQPHQLTKSAKTQITKFIKLYSQIDLCQLENVVYDTNTKTITSFSNNFLLESETQMYQSQIDSYLTFLNEEVQKVKKKFKFTLGLCKDEETFCTQQKQSKNIVKTWLCLSEIHCEEIYCI